MEFLASAYGPRLINHDLAWLYLYL